MIRAYARQLEKDPNETFIKFVDSVVLDPNCDRALLESMMEALQIRLANSSIEMCTAYNTITAKLK